MKFTTLIFALILAGCSSLFADETSVKMSKEGYKKPDKKPDKKTVLTLSADSPILKGSKELGEIIVYREGGCDLIHTRRELRKEAEKLGGDALVVTSVVNDPTPRTCLEVHAQVYKFTDEMAWPVVDNPWRTEAGYQWNSAVPLDSIEGEWELHVKLLSKKGKVRQLIPRAYDLVIFADSTLQGMEFTAYTFDPRRENWKFGYIKAGFRKVSETEYEGIWYTGSFVEKQFTARLTTYGDLIITYPAISSEEDGMIEISGYSVEKPHYETESDSLADSAGFKLDDSEFQAHHVNPSFTKQVVPKYPKVARKASIEGTVWVKILVDKKGKADRALIAKSSGLNVGFEEAALKAARRCKFSPAYQDGEPIAMWVTFPFRFAMER